MANIEMKLSQAAFDGTDLTYDGDDENLLFTLSSQLADAMSGVQDDSADVNGYVLEGGKLRLNFPDGSYDQLNNVVLATPGALKGTGTASGATLFVPNEGLAEETGQYNFSYDLTGAQPVLHRISSTTTSLTLKSQLPVNSPSYDPVLGNGTLQVKGSVTVDAAGNLAGTVNSVALTADKLLTSASITGTFQLSNAGALDVHGTLDAVNVQFADGSYVKASSLGMVIDSTSLTDPFGAAAGDLPGNDTIRVELPARLTEAYEFDAGAGNDTITVAGGGGFLHVLAGTGDDTITVLSDHLQVDGGTGQDTVVYAGARNAYTVSKTATGFDVTGNGGVDHLLNVERLQFAGGTGETVAFDVAGNAGQAYRIYQAAFDRAPDSVGLGYWINVLDHGASLQSVAAGFIGSAEFSTRYGANPTNEAFVKQLYDNVLHRQYDQGGYDYWLNNLNHGQSRAAVLASFGESPENQAQVIGSIQNGIAYTPYHG